MSKDADTPTQVQVHYVKASDFRSAHVDGGIGGLTPSLRGIHLALYSERLAIPKTTVHPVKEGQIIQGETIEVVSRTGIVRELQMDAFMTIESAERIRNWLTDQLKEYRKVSKRLEAKKDG